MADDLDGLLAWVDDPASATFQVLRARRGKATVRAVRHPDGSRLSAEEAAEVVDEEGPVADLVAIADFGEPIYPKFAEVAEALTAAEIVFATAASKWTQVTKDNIAMAFRNSHAQTCLLEGR